MGTGEEEYTGAELRRKIVQKHKVRSIVLVLPLPPSHPIRRIPCKNSVISMALQQLSLRLSRSEQPILSGHAKRAKGGNSITI